MVKQKLALSIDKNLIGFARHLGLNLNAFLEERLKEVRGKIEKLGSAGAGNRTRAVSLEGSNHNP